MSLSHSGGWKQGLAQIHLQFMEGAVLRVECGMAEPGCRDRGVARLLSR